MMRIVAVIAALAVWLAAETATGKYVIEYGIFGKMGVAEATLERNATEYAIVMRAEATGLAKILSGGRVEIYKSRGRIDENGTLVPDLFSKDIRHSGKRRIKRYRFDHQKREIGVHEERYLDGKLVKEKNSTLSYYADNDIFSLYFNIRAIIGDCDRPFDRYLHAVGAQKKTGKVRVETVVSRKRRLFVKELLGPAQCYLKVTIYQKLFGSKGGELYLGLRDDGIATSAVLKDVVMFGDVRGRMVEYKESR